VAGVSRAGTAAQSLVCSKLIRKLAISALACLALAGCEADVSSPGATERSALLAPDFIAAAAANATNDPQAKWLLHRPKPVRESYVHEVLDKKGERTLLSTAWLLRQPDDVRESYLRDVVDPQLAP
jgi:hypothetical protein